MLDRSYSFTTRFDGLNSSLYNDCSVSKLNDGTLHSFRAIWDTGATNSVVSAQVVSLCGLTAIGFETVHTVSTTEVVEAYQVQMGLPNGVLVAPVKVTKGRIAGGDVLIGMDIISQGDFAVSNLGGHTQFSFRIPSQVEVDFVAQDNRASIRNPQMINARSKARANNWSQKKKRRRRR